tara:strand:- start:1275 stop:1910 length:636 start_codon:yes stop_codon:yes gene_type:complete
MTVIETRYYAKEFPDAEKVNPIILDLYKSEKDKQVEDLKNGIRKDYPWRFFLDQRDKVKEVDTLLTWVESCIPRLSFDFSQTSMPDLAAEPYLEDSKLWDRSKGIFPWGGGGECGFDPYGFEIMDAWGMYYLKGEGIIRHNHFPYPIAFVYYVNTPEGCSSVILEDKQLDPEAGQILFFEGHLWHEVPAAPVDGRCVISGLISYSNHRFLK